MEIFSFIEQMYISRHILKFIVYFNNSLLPIIRFFSIELEWMSTISTYYSYIKSISPLSSNWYNLSN